VSNAGELTARMAEITEEEYAVSMVDSGSEVGSEHAMEEDGAFAWTECGVWTYRDAYRTGRGNSWRVGESGGERPSGGGGAWTRRTRRTDAGMAYAEAGGSTRARVGGC
jgi:hypothetical protein